MEIKANSKLKDFLVDIDSLSFDSDNPRIHDDRNLEVIMKSLEVYGQQTPIVHKNNVVVKGNGTLDAARKLGWKKIAAIPTSLEGDHLREYKLVDNRSSDLSFFDAPALGKELKGLLDSGVDLQPLGWDENELKEILMDDEGIIDEKVSDASLLKELGVTIDDPKTILSPGDVRELGAHVLIVADPVKQVSFWLPHVDENCIFAPFPGPYIALTLLAKEKKIVMVQPDVFIAGYIVDRYNEIHEKNSGKV